MSNKTYFDTDFLGNKINIGDTVIFEAPKYRHFTFGKVVTKAEKSCQIEYVNDWNYSDGYMEICRQGYAQIIKHIDVETIKFKAVKEFVERLKNETTGRYEDIAYKDLFFSVIDDLANEMVGED